MPLEQHIVCFLLWAGTNSACIALFPGRFVSIEKESRSGDREEEEKWHGDGDGMAMAPRRRTRRTLSQIEIESASGAEQFEVVCYVVIALLLILLK